MPSIATTDSFKAYTTFADKEYDCDHGRDNHPIVPEPSTYGLCVLGTSIALVGWARRKMRRNIKSSS